MTEQFDISALEQALTKKERKKQEASKVEQKPKTKRRNPNNPLFTPIDAKGEEVKPKDMKVGKVYRVRKNE